MSYVERQYYTPERSRKPHRSTISQINTLEDEIRDKLQFASRNKSPTKEFIGLNGETDPNVLLQTMVKKLMREMQESKSQ